MNIHDLLTIGRETLAKMKGQSVFSSSKMKVKTLTSASKIRIADDRVVDSALLLQRFFVVSQTAELTLYEIMNYNTLLFL